jgi:hypothetical protein
MQYEYGIMLTRTGEIHRSGMTEEQVTRWLADYRRYYRRNKPYVADYFTAARRPLGEWEAIETEAPPAAKIEEPVR